MDFATRKHHYNRCDPFESLGPDDERNVQLDGDDLRGPSCAALLATRVALLNQPVFELFSGLPGSGKSTELRRLAARLGQPGASRCLVVLIDADQAIDIHTPVDVTDILANIVHHAERAVLELEGRDADAANQDGYLTRLWRWLAQTDVALKKTEFHVADAATLTFEMRTRETLRERVRSIVANHLRDFVREAKDELVQLQARARKRDCPGGIVVIFDSLEKLHGSSKSWERVLDSAEQCFSSGAAHLTLPVHAIYTVPPALLTRIHAPVEFMPMVKVRTPDGEPSEKGCRAMEDIVRRRVPDSVLAAALGPDWQDRLRRMVAATAGYPRDLVRLVQRLFEFETVPLDERTFARLLRESWDAYERIVTTNAYEWLATVWAERTLSIRDDKHRQAADRMLSNNVVLRYLNDRDWWALHPAVEAIPAVREAYDKLRKLNSA